MNAVKSKVVSWAKNVSEFLTCRRKDTWKVKKEQKWVDVSHQFIPREQATQKGAAPAIGGIQAK